MSDRKKQARERRRARLGLPFLEKPRRCGGVIDLDVTTREDLIARGFTPEAADEVLAFGDKLRQKKKENTTRPGREL